MQINLNGSRIRLERGRLLSVDPTVRTRVTVLRGSLWITQDGNRRDYELAAGGSFVARTGDRLVIQAEVDSELAIYEPRPVPWLTRLLDRWMARGRRFAAY